MKADQDVKKGLPHCYPFLMIDRVIELEPGRRAIAIKVVSFDDFFLSGHYPRDPCIPEGLILEALAQTGGIALLSTREGGTGVLVKVEEMKFEKALRPGGRLKLCAEVEFRFSGMAKVRVRAEAEGETVAQGVLVLAEGTR
ncbi:MAG: 3-hydroxyacyl-ACP dehydratase FabZ [Deltaproteobacteria bacterium]|nr:3-hydroxyacyl-ACP dehydratase FabZ [Deltaproteobacteria bacterium]